MTRFELTIYIFLHCSIMQVFINLIVPINETNHIIKKKKKTLHKHSNKIQEKLKNDKKMEKKSLKFYLS